MLVVNDISARYGRKPVLQGLSLRSAPGHLTAIVGPNGSGKSTLLRAICGELPSTGHITLQGRDIATTPAWQLAALRAVLPQSTPMSFPFHAIEVVRLGLARGIEKFDDLPHRALARVGLAGYENRYYQELSGGEQQRVQLARVLSQVWDPIGPDGPRWLLLDEPVSSLDIGHQLQIMQIVRDFADAGGGVLAVMHDLNLSAMYADRVVLMDEGRVESSGTVSETLTNEKIQKVYRCAVTPNSSPEKGWYILPQSIASAL